MKKNYLWYRLLDNLPVIGGGFVILIVVAFFVLGIIAAIDNCCVLCAGDHRCD